MQELRVFESSRTSCWWLQQPNIYTNDSAARALLRACSACLLFLKCLQKGHLLSTLHTQSAVHALDWVSQGQQQQQLNADLLIVCCARQVHFLSAASSKPR
jgi:hypothetical protein